MDEEALSGTVQDMDQTQQGLSDAPTSERKLGWTMLVLGTVGLLAAFTLTIERFLLAGDASYVPTCSINPIISCGSVMTQWQASLLGFPNPLLGILGFGMLIMLSVVMTTGVLLPRWIHQGLQAGVSAGFVLILWLISQSLYDIHALCPYCMVVWAVMIPLFWVVTLRNLDVGNLRVPNALKRAAAGLVNYQVLAIFTTYVAVALMVLVEFWTYWQTLLP